MRRLSCLAFSLCLLLTSCGKQPQATQVSQVGPDEGKGHTVPATPVDAPKSFDALVDRFAEPTPQEKYEAHLLHALQLSSERRYAEAVRALEAAQAVQKTAQVEKEIERVQALARRQADAEKMLQAIQAVLAEGRAEEASRLAAQALLQCGDTEAADRLALLKRQADALRGTNRSDAPARFRQFKTEGDAALRENNLRAALLAYEQALAVEDAADVKAQAERLRGDLQRYDDCRRRAIELRQDPVNLEDAIAQLEAARKVWDTPEVQQQIADCKLALQVRRERLAVAEFEVRGETGIPAAGRTLADELLPHFKGRYDLVERGQVDRVLQELKLEQASLVNDEAARQEACRVGKVRYLVVGSVTRVSGVVVHARLIDVRTGLVLQSARVEGGSPEEVLGSTSRLARMLMMSDDQKVAFEQELAKQQQALTPVVPPDALPAAPEPVLPATPPPPIVASSPVPVDVGELRVDVFDNLPPPPPQGQQPVVVVVERDPLRRKMLHLHLELGDNLYRRGCYREAFGHFEVALLLAPNQHEVVLRHERCRDRLPPVVVAPRPRVAVLNFATYGSPRLVPPHLGFWTAENLAPYFCGDFEVVDRGLVNWYLRRLGLTVCDLMTDAYTRRWVGRALGVRYFVFGSLRETECFDVTAHLVDAEYGCEHGRGRIHVHSPAELKLRLPELARLTLLSPAERRRHERELEEQQALLVEAQRERERGRFSVAVEIYGKARQKRPFSVEVQVLFEATNDRARRIALEEERRREWERQQAVAVEHQRRQAELARLAQEAQLRAEREAQARAESERLAEERRRLQAYEQLVAQGQIALQNKNFKLSIEIFQSAVDLRPCDESHRHLAQARSRGEQAARAREAEALAAREQQLRLQREAELERARKQLEQERRQRAAQEQAERAAREEREKALYARLFDEGQRALAKKQYDAAIASFQSARQVKATEDVERLLAQALESQRTDAARKDADRERLEKKLADERRRREAAEAEAKKNRELYQEALKLARLALEQKKYDDAITGFKKAHTLFQTDEALTGVRQAEQARKQEQARAQAEAKRKADQEQKAARVRQLLNDGEAALKAQEWDRATAHFREVTRLEPGQIDALTGISKAEKGKESAALAQRQAADRKKAEERQQAQRKAEEERAARIQAMKERALQAIRTGRLDLAEKEINELKAQAPRDPAIGTLQNELKKATDALNAATQKADQEARMKAEVARLVKMGQAALKAGKTDVAAGHFQAALKVSPTDAEATAGLAEVQKAKQTAAQAAERQKEQAAFDKALADGKAALAAGKLDDAVKSLNEAKRLRPTDPQVAAELRKVESAKDAAERLKKQQEQREQTERAAFEKALADGKAALAAGKLDEAGKALNEAKRLRPTDAQVAAELRKVEAAKDAAERLKKQQEQRKADLDRLLQQGETALKARQPEKAAEAFQAALKLVPNDPTALKGLREAGQLQTAMKAEADRQKAEAEKQKAKQAYDAAMARGRQALQAGKHADAIAAFTEAGKLMPGDATAAAQLRAAQKAQADAMAAEQKQKEEAARKARLADLLGKAQAAMRAKRYQEAVNAYQQALQVMPNDPTATAGLREAQKALDAAKAPPPPPPARPPAQPPAQGGAYDKHMQAAQAAVLAQKYTEAVAAYQEALKAKPGDGAASGGQRFAQTMNEGVNHFNAKRFAEAEKSFQAAIKIDWRNVEAKRWLQRSRNKK